jgi:superfamily II DNA/RNA helicase
MNLKILKNKILNKSYIGTEILGFKYPQTIYQKIDREQGNKISLAQAKIIETALFDLLKESEIIDTMANALVKVISCIVFCDTKEHVVKAKNMLEEFEKQYLKVDYLHDLIMQKKNELLIKKSKL